MKAQTVFTITLMTTTAAMNVMSRVEAEVDSLSADSRRADFWYTSTTASSYDNAVALCVANGRVLAYFDDATEWQTGTQLAQAGGGNNVWAGPRADTALQWKNSHDNSPALFFNWRNGYEPPYANACGYIDVSPNWNQGMEAHPCSGSYSKTVLCRTAGAPATPSPTPSPTLATPSNGIAADVTNADGTWTPVAIISASNNVHASTGAVAGVKLSDADITALMQAGGDVVRLECGPCDAYFQAPSGSSWCSDCTRAMGNKLEECSLVSTGIAGPFQSSGYNNCHKGADCWQQSGGPIYEDCGGNGCNCNGAGRVAGTLYVKASAGPAAGGAAAVGDPHLQNVHGERFDLMKPGKHVLINIPRGVGAEKSLLRVQADARHLGGKCADMYFQEVNVTGSWADAKKSWRVSLQRDARWCRDSTMGCLW
jgi:hypothetical protein